ncbi:MAG: NADH-quinone oxidoreductase subunit J [Cyclobacteriaceae bacterium]|nr:NADH-quinone oxidoreductase subunit J [Cyclobacteriaceae bacterium]
MNALTIIFYIMAVLMVVFSIMAVTSRKLLRAAIYLLFVLIGVAVFYLAVDYMFLAAVQVVVYMGGILVLIIFSILLTSHLGERLQVVKPTTMLFAAVLSLVSAGVVISVINGFTFITSTFEGDKLTVAHIGQQLLSYDQFGYVLPFEVISILLLAAMIAAIAIAKYKHQGKS